MENLKIRLVPDRRLNKSDQHMAGLMMNVMLRSQKMEIVASIIMPIGAGAANGAERAPEEDLKQASLVREDLNTVVTTGYGRTAISDGDKSTTEITCHARGEALFATEM